MRRVLVLLAVLLAGSLNIAGPAAVTTAPAAAVSASHARIAGVRPYPTCNGVPIPC